MMPVDYLPSGDEGTPRDSGTRKFQAPASSASASGPCADDASRTRAAWNHLRAGARSDAQLVERSSEERARQQSALIEWARQGGKFVLDDDLQEHRVVSNRTSEHEVRYRASDERAVKLTWPGTYGQVPIIRGGKLERAVATPAEYLARTILHNTVFGEKIILEGINVSACPALVIGEPPGQPGFVISQPWHLALDPQHPIPTPEGVAEFMRSLGFISVAGSYFGWVRPMDGVVVADARPDNFILTDQGIAPIDLQMAQYDPALLPADWRVAD